MMGFKGSRKSTPYAAQVAAEDAGRKAAEHGVRTLEVEVKGPGSGRDTAVRSLHPVARRLPGALADLQRLSLAHGIALPTSFALVGKTLSRAESIARSLDPTLDPVQMIRSEGWNVMAQEAERRLEPNQLLASAFTQLQPLTRLPRRIAQLVQKLETGSLKVGIAPVDLDDVEELVRSSANRVGAAMIVSALLIASALMARVDHTLSVVGFALAATLGLYVLWRIARTPGGL